MHNGITGGSIRMKFKPHGIILGLFLALGLVFSFTIEASAGHGDGLDKTADQVDPTSQSDMEAFVQHIVNYYEQVRTKYSADETALIRHLTIFARDIRREGGDYRHGEVYAIGITDNNVITNHARYPQLIGYKVDPDAGTPLANTFKALLGSSAIGTTNCENYGQNKVACAEKVESDLTVDVTTIAGLHHEVNDAAFVEPDCTGLTLGTTAEDVFDTPSDANLEAYVKDVIGAVQEDIKDTTVDELEKLIGVEDLSAAEVIHLAPLLDPAKQAELDSSIKTRVQERLFCFGSGDFKHENIYIFVMGTDLEESTVIVNGNNFDLNGGNLKLKDYNLEGNDKTIAGLFNRKLAGGTSTYADYRWDDPLDTMDDIEKWFERDLVPGSSPKRSYIEVADLNKAAFDELLVQLAHIGITPGLLRGSFPEEPYIFGSGVYPDVPNVPHMMDALQDDMTDDTMDDMTDDTMDDMTDDIVDEVVDAVSDGGCTIGGTSNTSQGTLLNLFLIASVLFSVVFLRRRA